MANSTSDADALGAQIPVSGSDTYMVTGTVTRSDGTPARGLAVSAFDQDMRKRQLLGRGRTGADGGFQITYPVSAFWQAEEGGPDLVVEVYGQHEEVLATTPVHFNTPRLATINITLAQHGSEAEYDRIVRLLMPLLDGQGVTLDTLEENNQYHD